MKKIVLVVSIIAVIAMAVLNLTYQDGIKPDVEFPIANHGIWN